MIFRCILADWAAAKFPDRKKVLEGEFNAAQIQSLNEQQYNIFYFPNYPKQYDSIRQITGQDIDVFKWVFVDMDIKSGIYPDKMAFRTKLNEFSLPPTSIVDSGHGVHAYWSIIDLNALDFLRLQRRLARYFKTDLAVSKLMQLMRLPGTVNTKEERFPSRCYLIGGNRKGYACEELDRVLPKTTHEDEIYCTNHYNRTYSLPTSAPPGASASPSDILPLSFVKLLGENKEVQTLWAQSDVPDRSKADWRLGQLMHASGLSKRDALAVLSNCPKALSRSPVHRLGYAEQIADKIWVPEGEQLSSSVEDILTQAGKELKGTRLPCWQWVDDTEHGFRLGQIIGLVAGSGVGKTAFALNLFLGFVKSNPDLYHFFVPLEQPANEIADRWKTMCGENTRLHSKVHVLSNYDADGGFRNLSLDAIRKYLLEFKTKHKKEIGCVVIDHIGALKKENRNGDTQSLVDICQEMKSFAVETNTLLVMQSQAPKGKAGIGDLELDKDAAYGTMYFESFCDYLVTLWQPLKRCYEEEGCPAVTAFKFCKIRHKRRGVDRIQEDVCYHILFDPKTERMKKMTQDQEAAFNFFNKKATNKRKRDRKTDLIEYQHAFTHLPDDTD